MKGAGKAFENRIMELSVTLYPQKYLRLYKNNPTMVRPKETGQWRFAKRRQSEAPVDFFGYLHHIIVLLEAKAIEVKDAGQWQKARFPIGDPKRIPPHQQKALIDCEQEGGLAFYLIWVYTEPAMQGTYFLLSPNWAEFICNSLGAPVTIPLSKFDDGNILHFKLFEDLADLPKILKTIAIQRKLREIRKE